MKYIKYILIILVVVLVLSSIAGNSSFGPSGGKDTTEAGTTNAPAPGGSSGSSGSSPAASSSASSDSGSSVVPEPTVSTLDWQFSTIYEDGFFARMENGGWIMNDDTGNEWTFVASNRRVGMREDFTITDEKIMIRCNSPIQARYYGMFWNSGASMALQDAFLGFDNVQTIVFRDSNNAEIDIETVKRNVEIYLVKELRDNLQQSALSDEHLNYLIHMLVSPGKYTESSVDTLMYWTDQIYPSDVTTDFHNNVVCMRYPVSVPHTIQVDIAEGNDYILYLFESVDSARTTATVGWTEAKTFAIPANTPFVIALRSDTGTILCTDWDDIVTLTIQ